MTTLVKISPKSLQNSKLFDNVIGNRKRLTVELDILAGEEGPARRCWLDEYTSYMLSGQNMLVR